jgi:hypothetical protein
VVLSVVDNFVGANVLLRLVHMIEEISGVIRVAL